MFYAYDVYGCFEEGTAILSIYAIECSQVKEVRRMKCGRILWDKLRGHDQKGRQAELKRLYQSLIWR